jgi:cell division septum initiation protein DivIVA
MHPNEMRLLQRLRNPQLAHSLRGFDEAETRRLLGEAAVALEMAYKDRDRMREEARVAALKAEETTNAEAIGRALLTATATGEQIVASAKEQAEHVVAEAAAEAERMLDRARAAGEEVERERGGLQREREDARRQLELDRQDVLASARVEADRLLTAARSEAARLQQDADRLAEDLEAKRAGFVERATAALEHVERIESRGSGEDQVGDGLVADLQPIQLRAHAENQG